MNSRAGWCHRSGVTLLEILAGMLIVAFAFIPIMGVIGTSSSDTDVVNSYIFAQTTARNILDTILDDVPFDAVRVSSGNIADADGSFPEANVGQIASLTGGGMLDYNASNLLAMFGNTSDNAARGELVDGRGNRYFIKLYVFPIPTNDSFDRTSELCFQYMPRPVYENAVDSDNRNIWYRTGSFDSYVRATVPRPYDYPTPAVRRLGARDLGAPAGPNDDYCVMKRLLLRVRWSGPKGGEKRLEIYTAKANLSSRDFQ